MNYALRVQQKSIKEDALILAVETSCDETAAALVRGKTVLGNSVYSQIPLHQRYGGVVPELASRSHIEKIGETVRAALTEAGVPFSALDAVAVTQGPGLVGALLVGVGYAKALAFALSLPLVAVNHIAGHIAANYLTHPGLEPPFICLVVSGGHSHIVRVDGYTRFSLLGRTRDDAAGEAFDKVARVLGLPYPGGPNLEELACSGKPDALRFSGSFHSAEHFDFSFSGMKTAVINALHTAAQKGEPLNKADVAASFQAAVIDVLCAKAVRAARESGLGALALAGGVAANGALRRALAERASGAGLRFYCPAPAYTTDNAAMIGCAGAFLLQEGVLADLSLNARPDLQIFQSV